MSDFDIESLETGKEQLHMMVRSEPKFSPLQIRRLKQMSTIAIWKKHRNYLKHAFYKKKTLGTGGYFVSYIEDVSQETITMCIGNQE